MNKYKNRYILLLLVIATNSCRVSKDISAPNARLPESTRGKTISTDITSIADLPYHSFFTDATLQELIDSAIARNYDMQLALKNIDAAQLLLKQVKWNYVPTASLQVGASTSSTSANSLTGLSLSQFLGTQHIEDFSAAASLSWEADIWRKIRNQNNAVLAKYLQTQEARKVTQTELVANVAKGYYNLLMLDEQLSIAKKNVALSDSTLEIIKLQYASGQVTSLAIDQALAQQLAAAHLIPQFEQNIIIQENALSILTGEMPKAVSRTARLSEITFSEELSTGVPGNLVARRPDVRSYELQLTIENASVGISKAEMYPAVRITASGGINSFMATNWFNIPASLFGIVSGSVLQPLLQHKELSTKYEVAKIDREKSVVEFRQAVLIAVGEISDALVKVDKLKAQETIAANRAQTLQHVSANANMLFKSGMANYLEVIIAQSNVLQGELELASIKKSELEAAVALYQSLGGGWR